MGKKRYLEYKVNHLLNMFPIVAILGPRQCGKSTLVKEAYPTWKYYDLEDPDHFQLISSNPKTFFELNNEKIIIDESQLYPELFNILRTVVDMDRRKKSRFILTGSSSPEIVKGLTESLAGRIATVEMWPFKVGENVEKEMSEIYTLFFKENVTFQDFEKLNKNASLEEYMMTWFKGSFPEPLIEGAQKPYFHTHWYQNYINNYIRRDVRDLFPRLNIQNFQRFLLSLAQYSGHQLNMSAIATALEVSNSTIKDYFDIIHQTFIWRNLPVFEKNLLKKVQKSPRGFFRDQGILHHLLKIKSLDDLLLHPVAGFSFESFVIEEIIRGVQSTMQTQVDFSFYRTIDKSEIDLIIDSPEGYIPIEIKLGSSIKQSSLRGLKVFLSDTKSPFGILINTSDRIERVAENIFQIPITYL